MDKEIIAYGEYSKIEELGQLAIEKGLVPRVVGMVHFDDTYDGNAGEPPYATRWVVLTKQGIKTITARGRSYDYTPTRFERRFYESKDDQETERIILDEFSEIESLNIQDFYEFSLHKYYFTANSIFSEIDKVVQRHRDVRQNIEKLLA